MAAERPIFPTAYTPVYSNEAFAILGLVLSNITGLPVEQLLDEKLVKGLGLKSTSYTVPPEITSHDVIPGSPLAANWNADLGIFGV